MCSRGQRRPRGLHLCLRDGGRLLFKVGNPKLFKVGTLDAINDH